MHQYLEAIEMKLGLNNSISVIVEDCQMERSSGAKQPTGSQPELNFYQVYDGNKG